MPTFIFPNEGVIPFSIFNYEDFVGKIKANRELVIIDHLKNAYGKTETHGYAKIYSDKESLSKIETKPSMERHKDIDSHSSEKETKEAPAEQVADEEEAPPEDASANEEEKTDE